VPPLYVFLRALPSLCPDSDAADYVRTHFMSPPILQSRLAAHLQQHARPGLFSDMLLDLISRMLCFDPTKRVTAADALRHPYFADCAEAHIDDGEVPVPDDGEGKSISEIFVVLKEKQAALRRQREADEQQDSKMGNDLPGL
jgi:serine/threonine protein kinase